MVKIGFANKFYEIPPLGSFKILWKCDTNVTGSHLSKGTIGPLVDKAIEYLDEMRFPRWTKTPDLTRTNSAAIHAYLDVQDGNSALGNLHCYIDPLQKMTWMCQTHAQQHYLDRECLERLQEFVCLHGGYVDLQQAMISVTLGSTTEADLFLALLTTTKHTFNISIKLSWRPEQKYMDELCLKISWTGTVVLEFDGIAPNVCFTRQRSEFFQSRSANIRLVTFLNYPRPYEQRLFMESCELQLSSSPPRSSYNWVEVQRAVVEFAESIYKRKVTTKVTTKECTLAIQDVQSALTSHGLSEASTITVYNSGWEGVLCLLEGAFVEMNTFSMEFPMALVASGRLRKMTAQLVDADADQTLYYMAHGHDDLKELNISVKGRNALDQIEHLAHLWRYTRISRRHTLLESTDGFDRTVVAEFVIGGLNGGTTGTDVLAPVIHGSGKENSVDFDFLLWNCDHFISPLSDFFASVLGKATRQHPSILTTFTLDMSSLTGRGLAGIQKILSQSSLEFLNVVCTLFHPDLSEIIAQVLGSIQWPTLKSLVLSGDSIDQWIRLWPSASAPWLLNLNISGTGSAPQELSHASVLFIHKVAYASPMMECRLQNVQPQDKHDW
ncbi:hypothetical protein BGZ82_001316, partial [Podila clonocystis]